MTTILAASTTLQVLDFVLIFAIVLVALILVRSVGR